MNKQEIVDRLISEGYDAKFIDDYMLSFSKNGMTTNIYANVQTFSVNNVSYKKGVLLLIEYDLSNGNSKGLELPDWLDELYHDKVVIDW